MLKFAFLVVVLVILVASTDGWFWSYTVGETSNESLEEITTKSNGNSTEKNREESRVTSPSLNADDSWFWWYTNEEANNESLAENTTKSNDNSTEKNREESRVTSPSLIADDSWFWWYTNEEANNESLTENTTKSNDNSTEKSREESRVTSPSLIANDSWFWWYTNEEANNESLAENNTKSNDNSTEKNREESRVTSPSLIADDSWFLWYTNEEANNESLAENTTKSNDTEKNRDESGVTSPSRMADEGWFWWYTNEETSVINENLEESTTESNNNSTEENIQDSLLSTPSPHEAPKPYYFGTASLNCLLMHHLVRKRSAQANEVSTWSYAHSFLYYDNFHFELGKDSRVYYDSNLLSDDCTYTLDKTPSGYSIIDVDCIKNCSDNYIEHYGAYHALHNNCHRFVNRMARILNGYSCPAWCEN